MMPAQLTAAVPNLASVGNEASPEMVAFNKDQKDKSELKLYLSPLGCVALWGY